MWEKHTGTKFEFCLHNFTAPLRVHEPSLLRGELVHRRGKVGSPIRGLRIAIISTHSLSAVIRCFELLLQLLPLQVFLLHIHVLLM